MPKHASAYMTISSLAFFDGLQITTLLAYCFLQAKDNEKSSNSLILQEDTCAIRLEQSHPKMGALRNKKI